MQFVNRLKLTALRAMLPKIDEKMAKDLESLLDQEWTDATVDEAKRIVVAHNSTWPNHPVYEGEPGTWCNKCKQAYWTPRCPNCQKGGFYW